MGHPQIKGDAKKPEILKVTARRIALLFSPKDTAVGNRSGLIGPFLSEGCLGTVPMSRKRNIWSFLWSDPF